MTIRPKDVQFLSHALELAHRGAGLVSPGAMVGAVVVKKGTRVGEGFYRYDQKKHAEVVAIEKAGQQARGATLYLNLEPCSHFGRTPPCADLVIQSGIRRVVCSMEDPNPLVSGKGFRKLRRAGIQVELGSLREEAVRLNEAFVHCITRGRPFVTLKAAMTLDGKIALGKQRRGSATWITSEASRERVQQIRHGQDAILVGINTILLDNPLLTDRSRKPRRRRLLRIVLDARLRLPLDSQLVKTADNDVLVFCDADSSARKRHELERRGVQAVSFPKHAGLPGRQSSSNWKFILGELAGRDIQSVLIEGGGETNASALQADIIDKFHFFVAPKILGGTRNISVFGGTGFQALTKATKISNVTLEHINGDILITGYPVRAGVW
jgi:diaminohydroxyphosphoribosylaminopyrimidine deaminase / 5-amino-6-(5-phosphoribosylamino)uracil reductase